MKISYNWIKALVPALTLSAPELAELLTSHSFETVITGAISIDPKVVVAKIEAIEPHPNADRLRLVTINDGTVQTKVVCGAQNISVGDVIPFSPPGTMVQDGDGQPFVLSTAKIRGVESPGMLNSPRELGLGEAHTGIYILPSDTPLGSRLVEHIPADTILEADILPDRAHDCLNHIGIAREVAALINAEVVMPVIKPLPEKSNDDWSIDIQSKNDVLRYIGVAFSDLKVQASPLWMQARLWSVGARPINNIVDITNYVMFEFGTPTHAFDADKLPNHVIGARVGESHEKMKTLDGQERELSPEALVITSDNVPVAIAGVMGGESSEVQESTKNLFLEVANFRAYAVQLSSASLKLITEGSVRHAKGISPVITENTAARSIGLFSEIAEAQIIGVYDYYPRQAEAIEIDFHPERPSAIAGTDIPLEEVKSILLRLRCEVKTDKDIWQVTPPIERLDLTGEHDLVEEVIRVYGLGKIPAVSLPTKKATPLSITVQWRESVRDVLVKQGMTEVYNYSFEDETILRFLGVILLNSERVKVLNPPSPEQAYLRQNLLPCLLKNALTNKAEFQKKFTGIEKALFEIGTVFCRGSAGRVGNIIEEEKIAGVLVGYNSAPSRRQEIVKQVLELFGIDGHFVEEEGHYTFWTENQFAIVGSDDTVLGYVSGVKPASKIGAKMGLSMAVFELSLSVLINKATREPQYIAKDVIDAKQYVAPSIYPPTYRDVSIIIDPQVTTEQVQEVIERAGGELVTNVDLFDVYETNVDNEAQKSLAFHIEYQSKSHTLTNEEVEELHNRIVQTLRQDLAAELRE